MARALLPVDVELAQAFLQAQSPESKVAWLACTIKGEAICLTKAHEVTAPLAATVDGLRTGVPLGELPTEEPR